ncbi:hypothetical protein BGY98DRAFT_983380 [Russula aff. rugulosa BPL654]|nr:hypothetical protein BGY98DRAFT_983380 [Russula aff. rugulosa BPL654]
MILTRSRFLACRFPVAWLSDTIGGPSCWHPKSGYPSSPLAVRTRAQRVTVLNAIGAQVQKK